MAAPARPSATAPSRTGTLAGALGRVRKIWRRLSRAIGDALPKGLYARSLIIIIAPMVLLQSVIAYTFMERHWQLVTRRLSAAVTADVAALMDIYESYPQDRNAETLSRIAGERLNLDIDILKGAKLPNPGPRPFFSILDEVLSEEIRRQIRRPFWIDTVGRSNLIEIRVAIPEGVMRVTARRNQAYASNSHIFLLWMTGSSLVLLGVAILFLRNQIKPILRLSAVAEGFGKGREIEFKPRGAREVRQAGHAFIEMKRRIERAMEQRTAMLNGVSHDLRTIITRFKLSLALVEQTPEVEDLQRDVDEMSRMLEGYLAFARGDSAETAAETDMRTLLEDLRSDVERLGAHVEAVEIEGSPLVTVRPDAMRRCLFNLAANAARYADTVAISGKREHRAFLIAIDDDGPGIPPESREDVFKPFVRLDDARQDAGGSGLGLAIARDIARAHGGDVGLHDSPLGGLRATVRIPA
ncbi:ATP-binding protein [Methylorubrum extorquens]|jgi:two-component system osmolarity sensor histidine kinase EnvZ|uniref:histidine kinase n=1 Tax=Methylorubrum extorquens TaxID=408 RepID=A0AAX3W8T9_METEX|nr:MULTISPECIES: ATP-binding protein [Methylobacteriaceae]KQO95023.1 ATPase [Methylobacterium sp. Leaf92]KQP87694.1 ATPase [Methylobacterium sp. Leaf119]MDF9865200.1 two-component system osmolarity sensor histidine kinase EnvZ [Methylorubrum pseudosasae]MDH6638770.1 two-component system osmolarity sensor histidine kinase EnvZ [Methylobacterium sp. SuP10 SLI 274]MDH6667958.1 two-component system osmolarity sensor histidine kinase EnvZ [Methylorubrum zatmanii]